MSEGADGVGSTDGRAVRLGLTSGMLVQQINEGDDTDESLLDDIAAVTGEPVLDEDSDEIVDAVLLWWRADDGDLVDALVDARRQLTETGVLWLLTPRPGRTGTVDATDVREAVPTAGLSQTTTVPVGADWSAVRLVSPKAHAKRR